MPLIETKGAASAQGFGEFLQQGQVNYIEDVFSTWLYTGNGSTQTITNGIDLSGKGGLVWTKRRVNTGGIGNTYHILTDTVRAANKQLYSNAAAAEATNSNMITSFSATGYSIGSDGNVNFSNAIPQTYVSWTFRKQPKFFDVVTYTGDGVDDRQISHSLGSKPGCVIIKRTDTTGDWAVSHRYDFGNVLFLNTTAAAIANPSSNSYFGYPADPLQSTYFTVGTNAATNANGGTYVAYLFAHDAGGFGLSGSDNVISCGSFTAGASGFGPVNLGYEPQYILFKRTDAIQNWYVWDTMRGMALTSGVSLSPNLSDAELNWGSSSYVYPTATGFQGDGDFFGNGANVIYIAIRRGPMRVPTSGTSVFAPTTRAGTGATATVNTGILTDAVWETGRSGQTNFAYDRLRGVAKQMTFTSTNGESTYTPTDTLTGFDSMTGFVVGADTSSYINGSGINYIYWNFRRAPSFFDEVCYTGNGVSGRAINHNLTVAPNLMILKTRTSGAINDWWVYNSIQPSNYLILNTTDATALTSVWSNFTSTSFQIDNAAAFNASSVKYVAYLFATCAGVSKVGTYTGTGALQTINCGFTGGARFVLIKRTDSTGDWYVYDSARGISSGNDPYLFLNSTAAEVTGTNYVDTTSVGFQVTAAAPAGLNANGGTYIFLAIA